MGFLAGKKALIAGVVSNRSIAYGIAKAMYREGAELAFTYQSEKLRDRVLEIAREFGSELVFQCDVASDTEIQSAFDQLKRHWNHIDILVHSIGFAPAEQLQGEYIDAVTREGFQIAHDVSVYSFSALAKAALPMLTPNSALLTLTHIASERCFENYNVMGLAKASLEASVRYLAMSLGPKGIRVNAISAGAIKTLAASGVKNLRNMLSWQEKVAPLRQNVTTEQVGNVAAFLCSDLASGVTGEIVYVDNGYHLMGIPSMDTAD